MTVTQIHSTSDWLIIDASFPNLSTDALYDYFTKPDLLTQWWVGDAPEVMPEVGGHYHFVWAHVNRHLRGTYKAAERGKVLAFSWMWDHDPGLPPREVCLVMRGTGTGSKCTILHGIYTNSAFDQADRQSHLEGWQHFLGKLAKK